MLGMTDSAKRPDNPLSVAWSHETTTSIAILLDVGYRGILVYIICLISIRNSVSDGATNISLLNIERSQYN